MPLLRERRQDIPELIEHFLSSRQLGPMRFRIDPGALQALAAHDWPGNVRELANVLERAQILAEDHVITLDDLPESLIEKTDTPAAPGADPRQLREVERRHIIDVLEQEKGNKVHAARSLGISRRALYRLIDKYGLERPRGKD
jgi:DNA-binding NtrC family response regulator